MAFDPSSLLDASHLVAFLLGSAVGAAGTYMADRFTDQRRMAEAKRSANESFERVSKLMPELIAEIRTDLLANKEHVLREFVILHSERLRFNHDKPRIELYESKLPAAKNQVAVLVSAGYVSVVRATDIPIYRLEEHFVAKLENAA
jgi:hypothetical protein